MLRNCSRTSESNKEEKKNSEHKKVEAQNQELEGKLISHTSPESHLHFRPKEHITFSTNGQHPTTSSV